MLERKNSSYKIVKTQTRKQLLESERRDQKRQKIKIEIVSDLDTVQNPPIEFRQIYD